MCHSHMMRSTCLGHSIGNLSFDLLAPCAIEFNRSTGVRHQVLKCMSSCRERACLRTALMVWAAPTGCDATLWGHVYNPERLIVKQKCISVRGPLWMRRMGRGATAFARKPTGQLQGFG